MTSRPVRRARTLAPPVVPLAALAAIAVADGVLAVARPPLLLAALLDWTGHVGTAVLVLALVGLPLTGPAARAAVAALIATVAIDADHVPLELFATDVLTGGTPRPYTHSLPGILLVTGVVALLGRRPAVTGGVALGLAVHLVRDMATAGGIAPLWPLTEAAAEVPYAAYAVLVAAAAAWLVRRPPTGGRSPRGPTA